MTAKKPPWQKPRPPGPKTKLTAEAVAAARARAEAAGRRYPNLVDNLWASRWDKRNRGAR